MRFSGCQELEQMEKEKHAKLTIDTVKQTRRYQQIALRRQKKKNVCMMITILKLRH